jgi:hypothetical protein
MARQDIDIGVEGNDGTGDSIRESFRKTNENFNELYGAFGVDGIISFTTLGDTPEVLLPNTIPLVNNTGTFVNLAELVSNSALDGDALDTITFDYSLDGKLVISTAFTQLSDDTQPLLGGPLNVGNNAIGNVAISESAVGDFNNRHNTELDIDDLVITKGFADRRYISTGLPIRVADEPDSTEGFIFQIADYTTGNLLIPSHGIDRAANGSAFVYSALFDDADNLTSGETYFIRFVNTDEIAVFEDRNDAELIDNNIALSRKITVSGNIAGDDVHRITDAGFDPSLEGNFLADVAMPRDSVVRRQGDTMTGELFLSDHPGELAGFGNVNGEDDLQAATKFYVDTTSFSSTQNIFVSTSGDDRMIGVPKGREGTSQDFAFRTVNAAAQRAEEIIRASDAEPGPYFQTVTTNNGDIDSTVTFADVVSPQSEQTRKLIEINKEYILREYVGYIEYEFPNFIFDRTDWQNDIELIVNAIAFDINRGLTANTLTRRSAEQFYATTVGRFKIQSETEQIVSAIEFARDLVNEILQNRLYLQKNVDSVSVNGERARVTTTQNHNLQTGNQVIFKNMGGMVEIEDQTAYVRVISDTEFELYEDSNITTLFDISSYTNYTTGGLIGVVYQPRVADFESIKIQQTFDTPDAGSAQQTAVGDKFDLVLNIIENGINAGQTEIFGNNYKIVLDNANQNSVDQANPDDVDMIPGKIIVGKESGARGRIVDVATNDGTENNNDSFELLQLNAVDFKVGETVEYGNFVKKKQITIFVESGIYEEDLPIKLSNNVSLKGDEFRRVIIRPNSRTSQSVYANTYFYRDIEFDDISILDKRHSTVSTVADGAPQSITVDDTSWMSVNQPVKFAGETLFVSEVEKNTTYFITGIISSTEITISETEGGSDISFSAATGTMYIVDDAVSPFLNQTNQVQGYFGRHYLEDFTKEQNIGAKPNNTGDYETAANILQLNKSFLLEELILYVNNSINTANSTIDTSSIWFGFTYDTTKWQSNIRLVIDAISRDLERGGSEFSLETQGEIFRFILIQEQTQFQDVLDRIIFYTNQLLIEQQPQQVGSIAPDISLGSTEGITVSIVQDLISLIQFAFNSDYNPPKRNDADGVDVFQMGDATIVRNVTVQGQGGFMVVLDPESQILTKSPYIQTGSSFSKSDNEKRFRGGMFVDAFVGNIPARITNVVNAFELELESDFGQGLFVRPPELPAPFYLEGIRYQVNAIANYDSGNGTVTIFLDSSSNPDSSGVGQGYQGSAPQEIFIQTAGNRSMLGNDFTQINDLGYGLVTNNGAFSEMVSMFTYYCNAAYYANNGSEIRSLNGSNGYGNFGLVAEGADPNEIPDQVTLTNPMAIPCKAYTTVEFTNAAEDPFITVYDLQTPPTNTSIITIDHGAAIGVVNYRVSAVTSLTDLEGETATTGVFSNEVYRLSLRADEAVTDDFFGQLQETVANDTPIEFRNVRTQIFSGVRNPDNLETRPSTAINFDESDLVTYRSLDFSTADSIADNLPDNTILSVLELDYDFIGLELDLDNISGGFGDSQGDTAVAVIDIPNPSRIERLTRDIAGRQPGDSGYLGGMIFTFAGKTHQIVDFDNSGSFAFITIEDVSDTNVNSSYIGTGLNIGIPNRERTFFAGLPDGATAEITIAISLLRATGHDFTQIGAGGYNDSNYPNVIFGRPENSLAEAYTDAATATSSQVWERRKGRVFFVTTDQEGFFRVGKFFTVDQATGSIEFSGDIGLTGANALGFTRGVTINEFSADDSFSDLSSQAVPTERATGGYINRVLGYNIQSNSQIDPAPAGNRIGPGFVALNGFSSMEGNLNLGNNQITNLALPGSDGSAATNKNFVDERAQAYDELNDLRNIELNNVAQNDILVGTGNKRIFVTPVTGGTISVGDTIGTTGGIKTGTVVDFEVYTDDIEGVLNIITYTETAGVFQIGETIFDQPGETANAVIVDGPVDEIANASEATNSVINVTVSRTTSGAEYDFQIQDNTLTNADVNSDAAISQSKLNMQKADLFDEDDATTGWNGTADKLQSDLGLAKFSDENFDTNEGFVRIKANGVVFAELNQVDQYQVYGRTASGVGDISAVNFSDVVNFGSGLEDGDFDNTVVAGDTGFPGEALVKLAEGEYGVSAISTGTGSDTIARRDQNGALDATVIRVAGFDTLSVVSSTIRFDTPGGARVFSAAGTNSDLLVTGFPGNIDVGETTRTNQSTFQSGSSFSGEGWLASDWIYTSFIEAGSEGDSTSTGIGLGAGNGFANSADDSIVFITNGLERLVVSNTGIATDNNLTVEGTTDLNGPANLNGDINLGDAGSDTITVIGRIDSNVLPDTNSSRNMGSSATRWDVMYANIFNGVATEAKYADLAEKYTADSEYDAGTVLVFGGEREVTTTSTKGDRRVAGVVSTNPAYLMNSDLVDSAVAVALQGRAPCKVLGKVAKGDLLVSSAIPGYAVVDNDARIATVIGKSLEDKTDDVKSVIEIVVGKT